jgi:hypothetical protein
MRRGADHELLDGVHEAFLRWRTTGSVDRSKILTRAAELLRADKRAFVPPTGRPSTIFGPVQPGTYSAAQLETITTSVAAQRRSIEALKAQLTASD